MRIQPIFLASPVYYENEQFSRDTEVFQQLLIGFSCHGQLCSPLKVMSLSETTKVLEQLGENSIPLIIPFSGATQKLILHIAKHCTRSLLWQYFPNDKLFSGEAASVIARVCSKNALPAVIDTWAHLNNRGVQVEMVFDKSTFQKKVRLFEQLGRIKTSRLLIVGYTQQWVVSTSVNERLIEDKFGIETVHIGLEELFDQYDATPNEVNQEFIRSYQSGAKQCLEPTEAQIDQAFRMYLALKELLVRYQCNALAISCFSLVKKLGVTSCLALSLLNDDPDYIAACEGDLDAAITLLVSKLVSGKPGFMGNPVFNLDNTLDLVHCTAARKLTGEGNLPYTIRSHHETGLSVAQRVEAGIGQKVTILRIGNEFQEAVLYTAKLVDNPELDTCRTQFRFKIDSTFDRLNQVLGCHHIITFGDYEQELRYLLEKYLGIKIR